jgi:hypothetical protein
MQNSVQQARRGPKFVGWTAVLLFCTGCHHSLSVEANTDATAKSGPVTVEVTGQVLETGIKRFGINLGGENYYDSGQMLRDFTFANPGFEGETWQSILRCASASATTCTDANQWNQWPANFLQGADFEVISGKSAGSHGTVLESVAADHTEQDQGISLRFAATDHPPDVGDFVLVRKSIPGDPTAGWWTSTTGGASFAAENSDLSPKTPGHQALRINALGDTQAATLSAYFDSFHGRSFVRLRGPLRLSFRAKSLQGAGKLDVDLRRQTERSPEMLLTRTISLTPSWRDYTIDFTADEQPGPVGTVALTFTDRGTDLLLDDAHLEILPASTQANPTAYRDEVVAALRALHPGILRYQDGDHLGSSVDNLILPIGARLRAGWSEGASKQLAIPVGLPEFLELCKAVGAEPWLTLPGATSPAEMTHLIEYLAGPSTSPYGGRRIAQAAPWTTVFPQIHLELGNEMWNGATFAGEAMPDPIAFGQRLKQVYSAARNSPWFHPANFDLDMGSFALIPDITRKELAAGGGFDSVSVAPYLLDSLDDASSTESILGPMFAEPEQIDSRPAGYMAQQAQVASSSGAHPRLSVYEVNLGTASGSAPQFAINESVPSLGAGLALIDHMLLMLRDLGIRDQAVWALTGFSNGFTNSATQASESTPLFGVVVDLGGDTNRRRPQYLAELLANQAIRSTLLAVKVTGAQPLWQQAKSLNDGIELRDAHTLQCFAFADGANRSLILLNLNRSAALPLAFTGANAPHGRVRLSRLGAANITDSNEDAERVVITHSDIAPFNAAAAFSLPAFSMTVLEWQAEARR